MMNLSIRRSTLSEAESNRHRRIAARGGDTKDVLVNNGFNTPELVISLLQTEFSLTGTA